MLINAIATILGGAVTAMLNLLPTATSLPQPIIDAYAALGPYVLMANSILPISEAFNVLTVILAFETSLFTINLAMFIYEKIRGPF